MPAARSAATLSKGGKVWRPARRKGQAMRWRAARRGLPIARCKHCIRKTCARWAAPRPPLAGKCLQEGGTPPYPPLKGGENGTRPRSLSLRTSPQAGVAIRNPLPARFRVWQRVGARCILLPFPQKRSPKPHASDSLFFMDLIEITADSSAGQRRYRRYTRRSDSGCRS